MDNRKSARGKKSELSEKCEEFKRISMEKLDRKNLDFQRNLDNYVTGIRVFGI